MVDLSTDSLILSGLDEYGESVPNSQYRDLFSNSPKECLEFPEYTFMDHFGKEIPSIPPRPVLYDYLKVRKGYTLYSRPSVYRARYIELQGQSNLGLQ